MSPSSDFVFACVGAAGVVGGASWAAHHAFVDPPRVAVLAWNDHLSRIDGRLQLVRARVTGRQIMLGQGALLACMLCLGAWSATWTVPALSAIAGVLGPRWWLARMHTARIVAIEAQLDTWLLLLAHALKATPALGEAMASTTTLVGGPLGQELELALREHALGSPLNVALVAMTNRVGSPVLSVAATTLEVARRTGGSLSQTLERSAASLREMARLEGVVRVKTAEGRSQAWVVSCVPAIVLWMLHELSPELIDVLFASTRGHVVLLIAALMWIGAIASAVRILRVDI